MARNSKIAFVFGGFVTAIAVALYPIFVYPLANKEEYKKSQKLNREGINQADVQPVGVKIWSDPFDPRTAGKR